MNPDTTRKFHRVLVWMRRTLRVADNGPLWQALREGTEVLPFVCANDGAGVEGDTPLRRFTRSALSDLDANLRRRGSALFLLDGDPMKQIPRVALALHAEALYVAEPADPVLKRGDVRLARALAGVGCAFTVIGDSDIPVSQGKRFDPAGTYVRKYLPELANVPAPFIQAPWEMGAALSGECSFRIGRDYPLPVVDHQVERGVALSFSSSAKRGRAGSADRRAGA